MDASSSASTSSPAPVIVSSTATLILLLSISAAIVFRSLIIRQRHRRLVQQAILDGTYVPGVFPPPPDGRRFGNRERKELGPKPVMYEANLAKPWSLYQLPTESFGMDVEKKDWVWDRMMPVSATLVNVPNDTESEPRPTSPPLPPLPQRRPLLDRLRCSRISHTPQVVEMTSTTSSLPPLYSSPTPGSPPSTVPAASPEPTPVRMTFLIAMPTPYARLHPVLHHRPLSTATASSLASDTKGKERVEVNMAEDSAQGEYEEGEVPVLELGVVEVAVTGEIPQ